MLQIFVGNKSDLEQEKGTSFQMGKELAMNTESHSLKPVPKLEKMAMLI